MAETEEAKKPDFRDGLSVHDLADGAMVLGQVDGEDVVLVRRGDEFFAVGAQYTHYHGRTPCTCARLDCVLATREGW